MKFSNLLQVTEVVSVKLEFKLNHLPHPQVHALNHLPPPHFFINKMLTEFTA